MILKTLSGNAGYMVKYFQKSNLKKLEHSQRKVGQQHSHGDATGQGLLEDLTCHGVGQITQFFR